jgi:hypothetical protein
MSRPLSSAGHLAALSALLLCLWAEAFVKAIFGIAPSEKNTGQMDMLRSVVKPATSKDFDESEWFFI